MKKLISATGLILLLAACTGKTNDVTTDTTEIYNTPLDSIVLSDPCILADSASHLYYMTGTGGKLWKSPDLAMWSAYDVVELDTASWMGAKPEIWAAELHKYGDKYYYFATFTNNSIVADSVRHLPRRASHVLVADKPGGPTAPFRLRTIFRPTCSLDGTFFVDNDSTPYMVYCHEWVQNNNGTVEIVPLKADLSSTAGEATVLFRASDSPWSAETIDGKELGYNRVTDGPWLFRTSTGRLGMIWTSWVHHDYTMGVAYSETGTLAGPWVQSQQPITPANFGHGMIFRDFEGRDLLSIHSHADVNGRYVRHPAFFSLDLSGDSLRIVERVYPKAE